MHTDYFQSSSGVQIPQAEAGSLDLQQIKIHAAAAALPQLQSVQKDVSRAASTRARPRSIRHSFTLPGRNVTQVRAAAVLCHPPALL